MYGADKSDAEIENNFRFQATRIGMRALNYTAELPEIHRAAMLENLMGLRNVEVPKSGMGTQAYNSTIGFIDGVISVCFE